MELRPYQREAVDAIYSYFSANDGNPLIVMPTGTGKSVVLATFLREAVEGWADTRVLVLTHVRELIQQDYAALIRLWPTAPAGIYSAGLNKRDIDAQILFAGIQSIYKRAYGVQRCDLVLIDEAHLLSESESGMYRQFLRDLRQINPMLKVIGLTATPYRMKTGLLHEGEGRLFTDVAYEVPILQMIEQGYLAPVVPKQTDTQLDVSGVGTRGGEFIAGELERAVDLDPINQSAVAEIVRHGADRGSWLIFCAGVQHATHIRDAIRSHGISCETVTGDTPTPERDRILAAFKSGQLRAVTNMGVLTTGFDAPGIDLIAMLRPTKSVGLYCLDNETEILTSRGWLGIGEVKPGDVAASLCIEDMRGKWSRVTAYLERNMSYDEVWVEYDAPRANFRVTGDHDLIISTKRHDGGMGSFRKVPAVKAACYAEGVYLPTSVIIDQPGVPLTDAEIYFIGMIMTDGSFSSHQATIYQSERYPDVISRIERCLDECGLAWSKSVNNIPSSFKSGFTRWRYSISAGKPKLGRQGTGFRHLMPFLDKDIAPGLMALSTAQFIVLLTAMHDGDGLKQENVDYTPRSWQICSARRNVIDRLQALASIHGMTANVRWDCGPSRKTPIGFVTITPKSWRKIGGTGNRPKIRVEPATNEKVWCVQTETGTIVTRRRGKVTVMGNCQMLGRGTRLANGKESCLVLDCAGNTLRHGPLDRVDGKVKRKGDSGGDAPVKTCPDCQTICHASVRQCSECGHEFPAPQPEISAFASTAAILSTQLRPEWLEVTRVGYKLHQKPDKPPTMRVDYLCGLVTHSEWVCFQHTGYPREKAIQWWRKRSPSPVPTSIMEAVTASPSLQTPTHIQVRPAGKYTEIVGVRFES